MRVSRRTLAPVLVGPAISAATGTGVALAAFSATTTKAGSTFSAANEDPTKEFGKDKDLTVQARTGDN